MTDLWTEASRGDEEAAQEGSLVAARERVLQFWGFLASALDRQDYENRKALIADRLDEAVGSEDRLRVVLEASLDNDFDVLDRARRAEAKAKDEKAMRDRLAREYLRREALRKKAQEVTETQTWMFPSRPIDNMKAWVVQVLRPGSTSSEYHDFDTEAEASAFQQMVTGKTALRKNAEKWRAEVTGIGENEWSNNAMEYDTREEAEAWLSDLSMRWFGYDMGRVVPVSTPKHEAVDPSEEVFQNFRSGSRRSARRLPFARKTAKQVEVFLNEQLDPDGRPLGMMRGYEEGDELRSAITYEAEGDDLTIAEEAFEVFNIGTGPLAQEYRSGRNRSLSVGDVVVIDGRSYAVDSVGYQRVAHKQALAAGDNVMVDVDGVLEHGIVAAIDGDWVELVHKDDGPDDMPARVERSRIIATKRTAGESLSWRTSSDLKELLVWANQAKNTTGQSYFIVENKASLVTGKYVACDSDTFESLYAYDDNWPVIEVISRYGNDLTHIDVVGRTASATWDEFLQVYDLTTGPDPFGPGSKGFYVTDMRRGHPVHDDPFATRDEAVAWAKKNWEKFAPTASRKTAEWAAYTVVDESKLSDEMHKRFIGYFESEAEAKAWAEASPPNGLGVPPDVWGDRVYLTSTPGNPEVTVVDGREVPFTGSRKTASVRYDTAKRVIESGQYEKLEGQLLDSMTAQALVVVYEALSPEAQSKFDSMPLGKLVEFAWSKVSKARRK